MDNKYDKLEQYFRNTILKDDSDTPIPSEELFSNAMEVVNSKKKKRRFFLLPYLIGLCVLLVLLLIKSQLELSELKQQKNVAPVVLQEDNNIESYSYQNLETSSTANINVNSNEDKVINKEIKNTEGIIDNFHTPQIFTPIKRILKNEAKKTLTNEAYSNISKTEEENESNSSTKMILESIGIIDYLPLVSNKKISLESDINNELSKLIVISPEVKINEIQKYSELKIGVSSNINLSNFSMNNIPTYGTMRLTQYEKFKIGSGFNLHLEKSISDKLFLKFTTGYQQYNNQSLLEDNMYYDNNKVTIASNGAIYYQSDVNLSNPLGDKRSSTMINLQETMNNNDIINEVNSISQQLKTITLGLELNRNLLSTKRFSLSAGLGFSSNYVIDSESKFDVTLSSSKFIHKHYEVLSMKNEVSKYFTLLNGNLNSEFILNDKIDFNLSIGYQQSLSSLRLKSSDKDPNTYLHNYIISLGSNYNF